MSINKRVVVSLAAAGSAAALVAWQLRKNSGRPAQPEAANGANRFDWRFDTQSRVLPLGRILRVELTSPAVVHWTTDQWDSVHDTRTRRLESRAHIAELPTADLPAGTRIHFTFFWPEANRWEGEDFELKVDQASQYAT